MRRSPVSIQDQPARSRFVSLLVSLALQVPDDHSPPPSSNPVAPTTFWVATCTTENVKEAVRNDWNRLDLVGCSLMSAPAATPSSFSLPVVGLFRNAIRLAAGKNKVLAGVAIDAEVDLGTTRDYGLAARLSRPAWSAKLSRLQWTHHLCLLRRFLDCPEGRICGAKKVIPWGALLSLPAPVLDCQRNQCDHADAPAAIQLPVAVDVPFVRSVSSLSWLQTDRWRSPAPSKK